MQSSSSLFKKFRAAVLVAGVFSAAPSRADAVDSQVFVRWRTDDPAERRSIERDVGLERVWTSSLVDGLQGFTVPASADRARVLRALTKDKRVVYAEANFKIRRHLEPFTRVYSGNELRALSHRAAPNDPMLAQQWALTTAKGLHAVEAWETTQGSKDVRVAVIDTGISLHADLADRVLPGYDFIDNTDVVRDTHGHGTHVSGVIGAVSNNGLGIAGINPNVSIVPIRAVPNDADETDANVIASFEFAVKSGARVANCSFGKAESSQAVGDTIEAAGRAGLLVVVAAGNDGADNNAHPAFPANFKTSNMIVVASSTPAGTLSFFSNYGLGIVDVAAPGSNIMSTITGNQYAAWSGTSMASPQVAGVAALTLSANPALTVAQLKDVLLNSAVKEANLATKVTTGARIDAQTAVAAARNLLVTPENP